MKTATRHTPIPMRTLPAIVVLSCLAACGGGGGGGTTTEDPILPGPTVDDTVPETVSGFRGAANGLIDDWAAGGLPDYTALAVVPTTGSARYTGYVYGDLSNNDDTVLDSLIGELSLEANFAATTASFTGTASNFIDSSDDDLTGSLTISGGSLNRDGNPANDATLRGITMSGTLTDSDGDSLVFGATLEGDFLGETADAVGGEAIGRVTIGAQSQNFDGGFIAEQ